MLRFLDTQRTLFLFLIFIVPVFFFDLTKTFYQQDEWYGLGDVLSLGPSAIFSGTDTLKVILGYGRVLADTLIFFLIAKFPFNIIPVSIFAIVFHTINTILVYLLAKRLVGGVLPAVVAASFFAFNQASSGAVIWAASGTGTLPATTFIILSILTFFKFLETSKKKWIFITFFLLYTSLFFKEIGIFLFAFLPLYHLFTKKIVFKELVENYFLFFIFFLISIGLIFLEFKSIPVEKDLFLTGSTSSYYPTLLSRIILYPLTSFSLLFIPTGTAFDFAKHLTWVYYPFFPSPLYDLLAQTAVLDMLAIVLTIVICFLFYLFLKKEKKEIKVKIIFLLSFVFLSFLPYVVVGKSHAYLESRYYYLAAVSGGILFGYLISKLSKIRNYGMAILALSFLFLLFHATEIKKEIIRQKDFAQERKGILEQVTRIKPQISSKTIFYITGDRNFYISEGNPVPMQQGMGYTLLVWYYANGNAPQALVDLIGKHFLWGMNEQGYKEVDDSGFGYFWDLDKLSNFLKETKIDKKGIIALYYDSKTKEFNDITQEIRNKL